MIEVRVNGEKVGEFKTIIDIPISINDWLIWLEEGEDK